VFTRAWYMFLSYRVHATPSTVFKCNFKSRLPSKPRSCRWYLSLRLLHQNFVYIFLLLHVHRAPQISLPLNATQSKILNWCNWVFDHRILTWAISILQGTSWEAKEIPLHGMETEGSLLCPEECTVDPVLDHMNSPHPPVMFRNWKLEGGKPKRLM